MVDQVLVHSLLLKYFIHVSVIGTREHVVFGFAVIISMFIHSFFADRHYHVSCYIFLQSIMNSEASTDLNRRIMNLNEHFTYRCNILFCNTVRNFESVNYMLILFLILTIF